MLYEKNDKNRMKTTWAYNPLVVNGVVAQRGTIKRCSPNENINICWVLMNRVNLWAILSQLIVKLTTHTAIKVRAFVVIAKIKT